MKWENRGHEFDALYQNYKKEGLTNRDFSIFGCGIIGNFYGRTLGTMGVLKCFYDSNVVGEVLGYTVKSPNMYRGEEILVLCASDKNIKEMKNFLKENGYEEHRDYWDYREFFEQYFSIVMLYEHGKLYSDMIQLSVTERCILKCKKCAHGCNKVPIDSQDIDVENLKLSVDNYFKYVDFVQYFLIIGGEPMIYRKLYEIVEYIGNKYRSRIGKLQITTNGIVTPDEHFLELCCRCSVNFRVSNYINAIPRVRANVEKTVELIKAKDVECVLVPEDQSWMDYGFDYVDRNGKELIKVFDDCRTQCHEIRIDKLYYCIMARSVNDNMKKNVGKNDYLLLVNEKGQMNTSQHEIMEYLFGYSENGYLEMCNFCNGKERTMYKIPVAEQEQNV